MGITHEWTGTVLTITSDSGTSSMDLKGEKGDTGIRGPQGVKGDTGEVDLSILNDYPTRGEMVGDDINAQAAAAAYTDEAIKNLTLHYVVEELPMEGQANRSYFVPSPDAITGNLYNEYVWINGTWELLTTQIPEIDLSPYLTKTQYEENDYIVEQGVSGIWTYRKWNSGMAECWGIYTASGVNAAAKNYNGFYYSDTIRVDYPFSFAQIPMTQVNGGSSSHLNFARTFGHDVASARFILMGLANITNTTINVDIHAIGRWK